jgi:tRNA pseudouridine synthase B
MFYKLYKEKGISSFNAIKKFAKENNIKKIGHCGTLDPLAEGLLVVASNDDTKMLEYIFSANKEYIVEAKLHYFSESYDEGEEIIKLQNSKKVTKEELLETLNIIKNIKEQIPPKFSAKKINGIRAYKLARENKEVKLNKITIEIFNLELLDFNYEKQTFKIKCLVSKGTYIRSLIHDIGLSLKTDAIVTSLIRTKIGNIFLGDKKNEKINDYSLIFNVSLLNLNVEYLSDIEQKKQIYFDKLKNKNENYLFLFDNQIIAYGLINFGNVKFTKVFYGRINEILRSKND